MKKIYFIIVIALLAGLNIFLLYTNLQRQNIINELKAVQLRAQNENVESENIKQFISKDVRLTQPEVALPDVGPELYVFFTIRSCGNCLRYEIPNLNEFYKKYPEKTNVYLLTKGGRFLKEDYGAIFPVTIIDPAKPIFNVTVNFSNPIAVLVDPSGTVYTIYYSQVGNKTKCNLFYNNMNQLFQVI